MYKSLTRVHVDGTVSMSGWWQFAHHVPQRVKQCKIIMKLLIAPAKSDSKICARCDDASFWTIEHILFECAGLNCICNQLWNAVGNERHDQLWVELKKVPIKDSLYVLLNAFNCTYISEWPEHCSHNMCIVGELCL